LVSINVPTSKALAVVESMERDMLRQDMEVMRRGIVIWLDSLQIVGMSLMFAALKLT
jgi:hypothetical protein